MRTLTYIPIMSPEIIMGVSLMMLFVLMRTKMGVPIQMGLLTLILSHITFNIPFVIFNVLPKLRQMDKNTYDAALDLGCNPFQAFYKVVIPAIMPGIMAGFLMAVTYSLDDFVISYFTSGPTSQTLPIAIWGQPVSYTHLGGVPAVERGDGDEVISADHQVVDAEMCIRDRP